MMAYQYPVHEITGVLLPYNNTVKRSHHWDYGVTKHFVTVSLTSTENFKVIFLFENFY